MRIGAACPGDFHQGFDSLVRGEGRWWLLVLRALKKYLGHDVCMIGQHNQEYYDEESGIQFLNINNMANRGDFDIVFSMDPWPNSGVDTNWISPLLNGIKTKHRVFAPFFNNDQANKHSTIPVVYPYYYENGICLPTCSGTLEDLSAIGNNYGKKNVVWFSKNSHENPEYLLQSFTNAVDYVKDKEGALIVVDGSVLATRDYPNKVQILNLVQSYPHVKLLNQWLPYSQMRRILKASAFITGIHHPVANPMSLDIVFDGGVTLQFENQRYCAPYDRLQQVLHIDFKHTEIEDIKNLYNYVYYNETNYTNHRNDLLTVARMYSEEALITQFGIFLDNLQ